jgi:hypothetical protein
MFVRNSLPAPAYRGLWGLELCSWVVPAGVPVLFLVGVVAVEPWRGSSGQVGGCCGPRRAGHCVWWVLDAVWRR